MMFLPVKKRSMFVCFWRLLVVAIVIVTTRGYGGMYLLTTNYTVGSHPSALSLGNLRGHNNFRDLAVANSGANSVSVRLCLDDGTFGREDAYAVDLQPVSVRYGDFNRDGQDDLVTANSGTNTVSVLMNLGVGANFRAATNFVVGTNSAPGPSDAFPADINGDSRVDLVVANYNENSVSVLTNSGDGIFAGLTNYDVGAEHPISAAIADINLDGLADIITANNGTNGTVSILLGQTNHIFAAAQTIDLFPGDDPRAVALVARDVDGDAVVDLVVANQNTNKVVVLYGTNDLSGNWSVRARYDCAIPGTVSPSSLSVRDMNHDGLMDIVVACSADTNIWIFLRNGNGSFEGAAFFPTGSGNVSAIAGSNFNNDDATDLVLANYSSNTVSILLYAEPLAYDLSKTVNEDAPTSVTLRGALLGGGSYVFMTNTLPSHGVLTGSPTNLIYTPATNYYGADSFTYTAIDLNAAATSAVATVTLTVLPVNDAPTFNLAVNQVTVMEDSPFTNFPGIITNMFTGTNEEAQTYIFLTTSSSNSFFSSRPTINPAGTLTFRPALNKVGTVQVRVQMRDNGGALRGGVSVSATQTFNIVVTPSPIKPLRGIYNGLYYEAGGIRHSAAGFFTFTMAASGSFSGRLSSYTGRDAFAGRFDYAGHAQLQINRVNNTPVTLDLQLDLNGGSDQVTGTITNIDLSPNNWSADIFGDRLVYNSQTNPAPQAGRYTMVVPGYTNAAASPTGNGYGTLTVGVAGNVSVSGRLGDNTAFSQTTSLSKNGQWPFYASLYAGQGLVLGWINFTNRLTSSLEGRANWIKTALGGNYYPNGFTITNWVEGSTYTAPGGGERVLDLSANCSVVVAGGNLDGSLTNSVFFTETNTVYSVDLSDLNSTLKLASSVSGTVSGSFVHPGFHSRRTFYGVVLQQQNTARGFFLGTNQSGSFQLRAD